MEEKLFEKAIEAVRHSCKAFCRIITVNDVGTNNSHQCGFYIPKSAASVLFKRLGVKGENMDKTVNILWQDMFNTQSRFIYYGRGTRNEYRITRFGKDFPFLQEESIGNLLVLAKETEEDYKAYVLSQDEDIEAFLEAFSLPPNHNGIIQKGRDEQSEERLQEVFKSWVETKLNFPSSQEVSHFSQTCGSQLMGLSPQQVRRDPDTTILRWIDLEYRLFRLLEDNFYKEIYTKPFPSIQAFIDKANEVLNRRKARAGKSLEHHLYSIFALANLKFEAQAVTEGNKRPDFLFPDSDSYRNLLFPVDKLIVLGAKTTCKDRWRQVLTEANRVETKYLFTLQQGISANQLAEMQENHLQLVIPQAHRKDFPKDYQPSLLNLSTFIAMVQEKQRG